MTNNSLVKNDSIVDLGLLDLKVSNRLAWLVLDVFMEDLDRYALSQWRLFDVTLCQELPREYMDILFCELTKRWHGIDPLGKNSPVSCQNVPCHRDQIAGSHESIIVNVWKQTGDLLIHDSLNGPIVATAPLDKGNIYKFNHFSSYHSVRYTGDINSFLIVVRASVTQFTS
jgi:hypothetical protein